MDHELENFLQMLEKGSRITPDAYHPVYGPGLADKNSKKVMGNKNPHTFSTWRASKKGPGLETFRIGRKVFTSVRSIMKAIQGDTGTGDAA